MNRDIYNYIVRDLLSSNAFYWTTGCPKKRLERIKEYAWYLVTNMNQKKYEHFERLVEREKRKES